MTLTINGESRHFDHVSTLSELIDALGLKGDRVAVELNRSIVSRPDWPSTPLRDGDKLEVVHFVGGGHS
jgi:sulfur carrier protein